MSSAMAGMAEGKEGRNEKAEGEDELGEKSIIIIIMIIIIITQKTFTSK